MIRIEIIPLGKVGLPEGYVSLLEDFDIYIIYIYKYTLNTQLGTPHHELGSERPHLLEKKWSSFTSSDRKGHDFKKCLLTRAKGIQEKNGRHIKMFKKPFWFDMG